MIRFESVSFNYRARGGPPAVRDVSFTLDAGESLAVLGRNGSGKSTLVRLANGILLPDSGTVTVDGSRTDDPSSLACLRTTVGVVFQRPGDQLVATSIEDEVAFGPENLGLEPAEIRIRVDAALEAVGLTGLERREPHLLSGGQQQLLAIAGVLALAPRYLVFDEPTSMLDPCGRMEVLGVIARLRALGHGVLHVTHDLLEAAACDRALVLVDGAIAFSGATSELLDDADLIWRLGLEMPPLLELASCLRRLGIKVPAAVSRPSQIVEALCP